MPRPTLHPFHEMAEHWSNALLESEFNHFMTFAERASSVITRESVDSLNPARRCGYCGDMFQEVCPHCDEHSMCCSCFALVCGCVIQMDGRTVTICAACRHCNSHCTCLRCSSCSAIRQLEQFCTTCEVCFYCCEGFTCSGCHSRLHESQCSECFRCEGCCRDTEEIIHSYSANPLRFLTFLGTPANGLFLGVELEVEVASGSNLSDIAQQWYDASEGFYILKHDGSLTYGFEIVTAPASLREHRKRWPALLQQPNLTTNVRADGTRSAGLHVHVSEKALSALTVSRLLTFMSDRTHRPTLIQIAGRPGTDYAQYPNQPSKWIGYRSGTKAFRQIVRGKYDYERSFGRYVVVNPTDKGTLEFRLFRSTKRPHRLLYRLEFVDAVCRWLMETSVKEKTWEQLEAFIRKNKGSYRHLITALDILASGRKLTTAA